VIAQESVDATLAGRGIGDADTGIVGVCLCWWNVEGCQCYGRCRRHAHYCPLHLTPCGRRVVATRVVQNCCHSVPKALRICSKSAVVLLAGEGVSLKTRWRKPLGALDSEQPPALRDLRSAVTNRNSASMVSMSRT